MPHDADITAQSLRAQVLVSLAAVGAFALGVLPALTYFTGIGGLVKFWLLPWLGYHFWMSTFTVVHHTAPHIPFKPAGEWNAAKAQLSGTVHCDYPRWCAAGLALCARVHARAVFGLAHRNNSMHCHPGSPVLHMYVRPCSSQQCALIVLSPNADWVFCDRMHW